MSFAYRCSKCRGRNTMPRHLLDYKRQPKCRHCGNDTFYMDLARQFRNDYCSCEGYHYTHRLKSKFCIHHPLYQLHVRVDRYGEDLLDVRIEMALDEEAHEHSPEEAPF